MPFGDIRAGHHSSILIFQLCLPAIALAQARRAGATRTNLESMGIFF